MTQSDIDKADQAKAVELLHMALARPDSDVGLYTTVQGKELLEQGRDELWIGLTILIAKLRISIEEKEGDEKAWDRPMAMVLCTLQKQYGFEIDELLNSALPVVLAMRQDVQAMEQAQQEREGVKWLN